jgi:hypothetical protein
MVKTGLNAMDEGRWQVLTSPWGFSERELKLITTVLPYARRVKMVARPSNYLFRPIRRLLSSLVSALEKALKGHHRENIGIWDSLSYLSGSYYTLDDIQVMYQAFMGLLVSGEVV